MVTRHLALAEQQDRDLEPVESLGLGIVADVLLHERRAELREDGIRDRAHGMAEVAVGLAQEREGRAAALRPALQRDGGVSGAGFRARLTIAAPAMTATMVNCTSSADRSGWIPIHGISGKETGRGGR